MEKLTISDLAPYLPYELSMIMQWPNSPHQIGILKSVGLHPYTGGENKLTVFVEFEKDNSRQIIYHKRTNNPICKPLLIPLNDLIKPIAGVIVERFYKSYNHFEETVRMVETEFQYIDDIPFWMLKIIYELHGDINNLIERGLAINKLSYA